MIKLLSLTGPSGSGKTTLAGEIINCLPAARLVPSYTTRNSRPSDLPGEYRYITPPQFEQWHEWDLFLWTAKHGGNHYGTMVEPIKEIFDDFLRRETKVGIMILVPSVIPLLRCYLKGLGKISLYDPVFVDPPERATLEERLHKRGDTEEQIKLRLDEASSWLEQSKTSGVRYKHIRNNSDVQTALEQLLGVINS